MAADSTDARVQRLREKPWGVFDFRRTIPEDEIFAVPGMLWTWEKRMLYYLAREEFTGEGAIADMGSFLGGSTICLAAGLGDRGFDGRVIHSYDLFKLGEAERQRYFPERSRGELGVRDVFDANLGKYLSLVEVHEGDVLSFPWENGPIEILFVDVAKSYKVMDHIVTGYFPALMPAKSLIVMQDYLSPQTGPWHHIVLEKLSDYVEYVVDGDTASTIFLLREPIPQEVLEACRWEGIPPDEKLALMDRAIEKLDTEEKKDFLRSNREILVSGRDRTWGMHYHEL